MIRNILDHCCGDRGRFVGKNGRFRVLGSTHCAVTPQEAVFCESSTGPNFETRSLDLRECSEGLPELNAVIYFIALRRTNAGTKVDWLESFGQARPLAFDETQARSTVFGNGGLSLDFAECSVRSLAFPRILISTS